MLRLERKPGEKIIVIYGDEKLTIDFNFVSRHRISLCFDGPKSFRVVREEVLDRHDEKGKSIDCVVDIPGEGVKRVGKCTERSIAGGSIVYDAVLSDGREVTGLSSDNIRRLSEEAAPSGSEA